MRIRAPLPIAAMLVPAALVAYAGASLADRRWWTAAAAAVVAGLLVTQHRRGRFAAYVLVSGIALRAVVTAAWPALAFAIAVVAALQTRAARRAWPRLVPGLRRGPRAAEPRDAADAAGPHAAGAVPR
jgi:hypothetical protein